jgi:hypothetical protein
MAAAAPVDEDGSPKQWKQGGFKTIPFIFGVISRISLGSSLLQHNRVPSK